MEVQIDRFVPNNGPAEQRRQERSNFFARHSGPPVGEFRRTLNLLRASDRGHPAFSAAIAESTGLCDDKLFDLVRRYSRRTTGLWTSLADQSFRDVGLDPFAACEGVKRFP